MCVLRRVTTEQAELGDNSAAAPLEPGVRPEAEDEQQIESLIHEHVHQKLQVILEGEMANALHDFVDKASPVISCISKVFGTYIWVWASLFPELVSEEHAVHV